MINERLAFTVEYKGITKVLKTNVVFAPSLQNQSTKKVKCMAIWDTGATSCAISTKMAKECGLVPVGKTEVHTANGTVSQNVYLVNVSLPNSVTVKSVSATEISEISGADALIGMDIMSLGDMALSNVDGKTVFTFRIPSCKCLDFVEENEKYKKQLAKQERRTKESNLKKINNQLCSCGSGKKYRYCCGKKATQKS